MNKELEKKIINIDTYIKEIEDRLYTSKKLREIIDIKEEVIAIYIEEYNSKEIKNIDLAKLSNLISKIESKEEKLYEEEIRDITDGDLKLMKNYIELLKDINKLNDIL